MEQGVLKYNSNGDVEEVIKELPEKVVREVKYGVIRLIGEKETRRVSWQTYHKLKTLPPDFTGKVSINELNIVVPVNQVCFMEERSEETEEWRDFARYPVESIIIDENYNIISRLTTQQIEKKYAVYGLATCHYKQIDDDQKAYDLVPEHIKTLAWCHKVEEGYHYSVFKILNYGIEQKR